MDKFQRNYNLVVQGAGGTQVNITRPFTMEFDINRNDSASVNEARIRVYNLAPLNRNTIRKDVQTILQRPMSLQAGYGANALPTIFSGNVQQAWSVREGVNMITEIVSHDGGFSSVNGISDHTFPGGTPQSAVILALMGDFPDIQAGTIGNYSSFSPRGNTYTGNTVDLLKEVSGGGFFIDNGVAHCLQNNECFTGEVKTIDSASGLLGTPVREEQNINFDMLFEPRLKICQLVQLISITEQSFNGFYKIISLRHRGTISDAVCGEAVTSVGLLALSAPQLVGS